MIETTKSLHPSIHRGFYLTFTLVAFPCSITWIQVPTSRDEHMYVAKASHSKQSYIPVDAGHLVQIPSLYIVPSLPRATFSQPYIIPLPNPPPKFPNLPNPNITIANLLNLKIQRVHTQEPLSNQTLDEQE